MAKRTVRVFQVDAFTRELFAGNPAGVVLGAEVLSDAEMQSIARELNNSDSAFVLPADGADHDLQVRFFTPVREAPFVGHATVATHVARLATGDAKPGRFRQKSKAGLYEVEVAGTADDALVSIGIPAPTMHAPIADEARRRLLDVLGIETAALDPKCPIQVIGRNNTRLAIGLRNAEQLAQMAPDLEALKKLTPHVGADGFFLFVRDAHGPGTIEARLFSPVLGIAEDPVSGNAYGMLGAYLAQHGLLSLAKGKATFVGHQGRSLGRPGEVRVEVETAGGRATVVRISGTARIVFRTELTLP
jgi:PhzF family phenazine biosynthesis protein